MKTREFNKLLKELSYDDGLLSPEKISMLDNDKKNEIISFLVKNRLPVLKNFICNTTDISWLYAMGYNTLAQGKKFEFLCTCENQSLINKKIVFSDTYPL